MHVYYKKAMVPIRNRKITKRKRSYRRKRFVRSLPRPLALRGQICNMKRTFYMQNWNPNTASVDGYWRYFTFRLSDLPNYTELLSLWDQFKISAIKVTFRPRYDNFGGNDTVDTTLPGVTAQGLTMAHVINDNGSQLVPSGAYNTSTLNSFLEQGSVRSYQGTKPFSVYFKPTVYTTISASATSRLIKAPYVMTQDGWNTAHRGFHMFLQDVNLTGTFNQSFDMFVTYYLRLKGLR